MFRSKGVLDSPPPPVNRGHVFAYMNRALCSCPCVDGFNFAPSNLHEAMASLRAANKRVASGIRFYYIKLERKHKSIVLVRVFKSLCSTLYKTLKFHPKIAPIPYSPSGMWSKHKRRTDPSWWGLVDLLQHNSHNLALVDRRHSPRRRHLWKIKIWRHFCIR